MKRLSMHVHFAMDLKQFIPRLISFSIVFPSVCTALFYRPTMLALGMLVAAIAIDEFQRTVQKY